jgi:hypothetical protein
MRLVANFAALLLALGICVGHVSSAGRFDDYFAPVVYFGGEGYYLKRKLETGTRQEGSLYGIRLTHERVRPWSWYWAAEGHWARGHLDGHSSRHFPIRSEMTDVDVEGRLGFTLRCCRLLLTPIVGIGYFSESNDFKPPTPLVVLVRTHVGYVPLGIVSRFYLRPRLSIGLDAKALLPFDGQAKVCDPELGESRLNFDPRIDYAIELPIRYRLCGRARNLELLLALFWRARSYGRHCGVTHDFYETRITIGGARLQLGYYF